MDEAFVRRAVEQADLGAVRLSLIQATGDAQIAAMKVSPIVVRGGSGISYVLNEADQEIVRERAVRFLMNEAASHVVSMPDDAQVRSLMDAAGVVLSDEEFEQRRPIPAFDDYPRAARWTNGPVKTPDDFLVVIIGGGFSGLGMAVQLQSLGLPYILLERRHELGGTWSRNTYPDARVDTPSTVYEFSFEKRYPWTEYFAKQPEVRTYLKHVARKHGVDAHIRLNQDVKGGVWNAADQVWELDVVGGDRAHQTIRANFVVSASGLFAAPRELRTEGVETFKGEIVHSTEWSEQHSAVGKRVGVIGNGSTGVQLLGRVAAAADHVDVFQRSPQWISPREKYGELVTAEDRWLIDNMPYYWNWARYTGALPTMDLYPLLVPDPEWQAKGGFFNEPNDAIRELLTNYMKDQVDNREDLIEKLTPNYPTFSRRMIVDNKWYRALLRDNVELVTTPIERITPTGIVTADGEERPLDMIITAIGFDIEKYVWPAEYTGVGGVRLQDVWSTGGARAYLGMMVTGFPNFFIMYGPNAQSVSGGGGTIPTHIEMWSRYIGQMIVTVLERDCASVDVDPKVFEDYNVRLQERAAGLIWLADPVTRDQNYYVVNGRLQVNTPWEVLEWHRMMNVLALDELNMVKASSAQSRAAAFAVNA